MKKNVGYLILLSSLLGLQGMAQDVNSIINKAETERIEKYLSSDELEGRRTFSKGIDKAAEFIANEFKQAGLTKLNNSYLQSFSKMSAKLETLKKLSVLRSRIYSKSKVNLRLCFQIRKNSKMNFRIKKIIYKI